MSEEDSLLENRTSSWFSKSQVTPVLSSLCCILVFISIIILTCSMPIVVNKITIPKYCNFIHNNFGPVIIVKNNCSEDMIVRSSRITNTTEDLVKINSSLTFNMTRYDYGIIYGLSLLSNFSNPIYTQFIYDFTTYFGEFSISLKNGYNIPLRFNLTQYLVTGSYSELLSPEKYPTMSIITEEMCPIDLRRYSNDVYVACSSPCTIFNNDFYCCWNEYACTFKYCFPGENKCIDTWCDGRNWNNYSNMFINSCNECEYTYCRTSIFLMSNQEISYSNECKKTFFSTYELTMC